jgi:hypothetical protein
MKKWELFLSFGPIFGAFSESFHVLQHKVEKRFFMGLDMIK